MATINVVLCLWVLLNSVTLSIQLEEENADKLMAGKLSCEDKLLSSLSNRLQTTPKTRYRQSEINLSQENQPEQTTSWPHKRLERSLITRNNVSSISEHQQNKCRIWIP